LKFERVFYESSCEEEEGIVKSDNFLKVENGKVKISIFIYNLWSRQVSTSCGWQFILFK